MFQPAFQRWEPNRFTRGRTATLKSGVQPINKIKRVGRSNERAHNTPNRANRTAQHPERQFVVIRRILTHASIIILITRTTSKQSHQNNILKTSPSPSPSPSSSPPSSPPSSRWANPAEHDQHSFTAPHTHTHEHTHVPASQAAALCASASRSARSCSSCWRSSSSKSSWSCSRLCAVSRGERERGRGREEGETETR